MPEINIQAIQSVVQGQNPSQFDPVRGISLSKVTTPEIIYTRVVYLLIWGIGVAAVLVIIWAGFNYMTAGGDAERAERAKKMIVGTIIGLLIMIGSYIIYNSIIKAVSWEPQQQISREA